MLKSFKEIFFIQDTAGHLDRGEANYFRVADYTKQLLYRILALALLWIIILIPTIKYFMLIFEGREISAGQAAVFIVQTLTTTGYGELLPFKSIPMVLISILLMISGVFLIFMIAGTLMASLVESRIKPRAPAYTHKAGHVVFTAYNETVGRTLGLLEHHRIPYVVAAEEQTWAVELMRRGIDTVCADPRYDEGLKNLNIKAARLVVAVNKDTDNISITLGVSTNSKTPVLAVMENEGRAELAYAAGAKKVVTLEEDLGRQLVDWICADASPTRFLELLQVEVSPETLAQLKPSIIHVGVASDFCGKTIGDARLRTVTGATVAAVWQEDGTISTALASNMINESTLLVLGPHDDVDRLASLMGGPGPGEYVVVIGAGRVGQEAGKRLNSAGIQPHVIDIYQRPLYFQGRLIVGDATKPHVLQEVNIEKANTLIVTINDDSLNIFSVLAARQINPGVNIMARAVHVDAIGRLHQAGANHVLSESLLGFQLLQMAMVEMGVLPKLSGYVVREVSWKGEPVTIYNLTTRHVGKFKVICVVEGTKVLEPARDYLLRAGVRLVVMGAPDYIEKLFGPGGTGEPVSRPGAGGGSM